MNLEGVVEGLLAEADRTDCEEGERDAGLPEGLRDPAARAGALELARAQLQKKERPRAAPCCPRAPRALPRAGREEMREEIGRCDFGTVPKALDAGVRPSDIVHPSDPDTQKLKAGNGAGGIAAMVTDAGYDNTYQVAQVEEEHGFEAICIQQKSSNGKEATETTGKATGRVRATREKREAHWERLCKPEKRARRRRRRETIEPAFGVIKEQMGFGRFRLRGLEKADLEWRLVVFAANVRKLTRNDSWKSYLKRARG